VYRCVNATTVEEACSIKAHLVFCLMLWSIAPITFCLIFECTVYLLCTGCQGEEYELLKSEGDWYLVKNKKGYVARFFYYYFCC